MTCELCGRDPGPGRFCQFCYSSRANTQVRAAGLDIRFVANVIDAIALWGVIAVAVIAAGIHEIGIAVAAVIACVALGGWLYLLNRGASPGKAALGLRVRHPRGEVPSLWSMLFRELIGKYISAAFLYIGYLWAIVDRDRQTWHDKMVGTVVVRPQAVPATERSSEPVMLLAILGFGAAAAGVFGTWADIDFLGVSETLDGRASDFYGEIVLIVAALGAAVSLLTFVIEMVGRPQVLRWLFSFAAFGLAAGVSIFVGIDFFDVADAEFVNIGYGLWATAAGAAVALVATVVQVGQVVTEGRPSEDALAEVEAPADESASVEGETPAEETSTEATAAETITEEVAAAEPEEEKEPELSLLLQPRE